LIAVVAHRSGGTRCKHKMARSKEDIDAERELAVGLVIGCALDVQTSNSVELVGGISGLEKLLTAIKQLSRVFGWPDESQNGDDESEHDDTRH
jgi:hypothetical protein